MSVTMPTSEPLTYLQFRAVCERITYCEAKVARYIRHQDIIMGYHIARVFTVDVYLNANERRLEAETNMLRQLRAQAVPASRSLIRTTMDKIAHIITCGDSLRAHIMVEERKNWKKYWRLEAKIMVWAERLLEARETLFEAELEAMAARAEQRRRRRCIIC